MINLKVFYFYVFLFEKLENIYVNTGLQLILFLLKLNKNVILKKVGVNMRKRWTIEEDDFLKFALDKGFSTKEMEEALDGRSQVSIRNRISALGLRKKIVAKEKDGLIRCYSCREYKDRSEFIKLKNGKYYSYCNDCKREITRKRYLRKKEEQLKGYLKEKHKTKTDVNNGNILKQCSRCKEEKNVDSFYWDIKGVKLSSVCKDCRKEMTKRYQEDRLRTKGY